MTIFKLFCIEAAERELVDVAPEAMFWPEDVREAAQGRFPEM